MGIAIIASNGQLLDIDCWQRVMRDSLARVAGTTVLPITGQAVAVSEGLVACDACSQLIE